MAAISLFRRIPLIYIIALSITTVISNKHTGGVLAQEGGAGAAPKDSKEDASSLVHAASWLLEAAKFVSGVKSEKKPDLGASKERHEIESFLNEVHKGKTSHLGRQGHAPDSGGETLLKATELVGDRDVTIVVQDRPHHSGGEAGDSGSPWKNVDVHIDSEDEDLYDNVEAERAFPKNKLEKAEMSKTSFRGGQSSEVRGNLNSNAEHLAMWRNPNLDPNNRMQADGGWRSWIGLGGGATTTTQSTPGDTTTGSIPEAGDSTTESTLEVEGSGDYEDDTTIGTTTLLPSATLETTTQKPVSTAEGEFTFDTRDSTEDPDSDAISRSTPKPGHRPESSRSTPKPGHTPESSRSTPKPGHTPESSRSTPKPGNTPESTTRYSEKFTQPSSTYAPEDRDFNSAIRSLYSGVSSGMVNAKLRDHRCPYFYDSTLEFQKWSNEFTNTLIHGCGAFNASIDIKCCHAPLKTVHSVIGQVTLVMQELTQLLSDQCTKCPVDCEWDQWSSWDRCPHFCEGETPLGTSRSRQKIRERAFGGVSCSGGSVQSKPCPATPRVQGMWLEWAPWSQCSDPCNGFRQRKRRCSDTTLCFTDCVGDSVQVEDCGDPKSRQCCKEPQWSSWLSWTDCESNPSTPGMGRRTRFRVCNKQDSAVCKFLDCGGPTEEEEICDDPCKRPTFGPWSEWSECLKNQVTVYESFQFRTRTCRRPQQTSCPDEVCSGDSIEMRRCEVCDPPMWSMWTEWTGCKRGVTSETRTRYCKESPNNGRICPQMGTCIGDATETKPCDTKKPCTEDHWGSWGEWSPCTSSSNTTDDDGKQCGKGCRGRTRACIPGNCKPYGAKTQCSGKSEDKDFNCHLGDCCVSATWSHWTAWSECKNDQQKRWRFCGHRDQSTWSRPLCQRSPCKPSVRPATEFQTCKEPDATCAKCEPAIWLSWEPWGLCDFLSKNPVRSRRRACRKPLFKHPYCAEAFCDGPDTQETFCDCARAEWGQWTGWDTCRQVRGSTFQERRRTCQRPALPAECRNAPPEWTDCQGASTDRQGCCLEKVEEWEWGTWGRWGPCQNRFQKRSRQCFPKHGTRVGRYGVPKCVGDAEMFQKCPEKPESEWTSWGPWQPCKPNGFRERVRVCQWKVGRAGKGQPLCNGRSIEEVPCRVPPSSCDESCAGRKDGEYPSCRSGCRNYIACCNGVANATLSCQGRTFFDSDCQKCLPVSGTCGAHTGNVDVHHLNYATDAAMLRRKAIRQGRCTRRR